MTQKKIKLGSPSRTFYYFWRALMQNKIRTALVFLLVPLNVVLGYIIVPIGTSQIIGLLGSGDLNFNDYILPLCLTIGALIVQDLFLIRIIDWLDWSLDAKGGYYLSNLAFEKIIAQSMTFHNNRFSGSLTSQANKLPGAFIRLKSNFIWSLYPLLLVVLSTIVTVLFISPIYATVLIVAVAAYSSLAIVTFLKTRHIDARLANAENKQTGQLADSITNILSVKSYARENYEKSRFARSAMRTHDATFGVAKVSMFRNFLLNLVNTIAFIVFLILIINGQSFFHLSVANVVLLYTLTYQLISQIWQLNHILRDFNRALGDAKEMVEILDSPISVTDHSDKILSVQKATIDFHNITFQHAEQKTPIFQNFNLEIQPGERVGLVGISGSGKTTLTKLLLRFADLEQGNILIDGQDISEVTQDSLRTHIAYVPQETFLFHRTIAENIAYGKPKASLAEIQTAAKLANAHEFIMSLPDQYETLVGERGVKLSGGQRQRIAIARAILKNAPILVLDEATSALDSESEALIQSALVKLMEKRTSLVIAHRLSTVASLDRIVVLQDGRIVEQGSHQDLIKKRGAYAKLWAKQAGTTLETDLEDQLL